MRAFALATLILAAPAFAEQPEEYVPAPAEQIPGYWKELLPCKLVEGERDSMGRIVDSSDVGSASNMATYVVCDGPAPDFDRLSLRELSILRNTIFARYGWAGFRKTWLREHFQQQPWYKPDPKFSYKRLSSVDRQNAELIAKAELSLRYVDLEQRRDTLLAKAGQTWGDAPMYEGRKRSFRSCDEELEPLTQENASTHWYWTQKIAASKDCRYHDKAHKKATPADHGLISSEELIELGLISRAMGEFALDDEQREQTASSLDSVLKVKELRKLSLRDLRLLRNTIFARKGRTFKSEVLQDHFKRMPWYTPREDYSDKLLTKTDKRNVELIRQVEEEFGGALLDKDFQVETPSEATDVPVLPTYMTV
ncbi:YARHG domain-containing protein [Archangium gephyra]|uniref:YARHG domain-containing protein n=1 Tax=Archangium gephyra TaxID=48 RepID=A0AAC8QDP1_9BACT|nr:YARHG domain-containing protein [Archangium gephyra]AKJ05424.1 Hypothetical protein AA314_07050 [Archangium gephyra]REG36107.1 YARHG domain-containing protein [Archangium gephyra]